LSLRGGSFDEAISFLKDEIASQKTLAMTT